MNNFRFVYRSLMRNRAFTIAAVLSLALGIGANTAIFTLADQILLRILPVKDPKQLVLLKWSGQFIGGSTRGLYDAFSYRAFEELRETKPATLSGIAARYQDTADVSTGGAAERVAAELVSGNYFEVLGVGARLGRTLTPSDDRVRDGEPYVVLSHDCWHRRFGGDGSVLNRTITLNGHPMTVVGVTQAGFRGFDALSPAEVFVPLAMKREVTPAWDDMERRNSIWLRVFGRIAPRASREAAAAALQPAYQAVLRNDLQALPRSAEFSERYLKNTVQLEDASKGLGQLQLFFAKPLKLMLAMVGILLLIACANTANLLVTRSIARYKEIAVRLSLGASRASLVRLIMLESLVLAAAGGVLGLIVSVWTASFLVQMLPYEGLRLALNPAPDWRILVFTAALTATTAVLFGLAPALQASRADVAPALKYESGGSISGKRHSRMRKALVAAQVTLSVVLLAGAGLFARSLYRVLSVDAGISTEHLLTFSVDPSLHRYTPQRARQFMADLQRALQQAPGAVSASGGSFPVLANSRWENTVVVEGYHARDDEDMQAGWNQVLPGFFSTMGTPLLAGREFNERDVDGAPRVVIVNESFVKRFFSGENGVGRRIGFGGPPSMEIIGVVKDVKGGDLKEDRKPWTYTAALQDPKPSAVSFYLRAKGDAGSLGQVVGQTVRKLDAALPIYDLKTMQTQIDETHFLDRVFAFLSAAFGLLASVLAAVGLYGVTAYSVTRRTQEIGLRIALGATRKSIVGLAMKESALVTAVGIAAGVVLALAMGRLVESQLFGVDGRDPFVIAGAAAVIAVVAVFSGLLPARRAARTEPTQALRY